MPDPYNAESAESLKRIADTLDWFKAHVAFEDLDRADLDEFYGRTPVEPPAPPVDDTETPPPPVDPEPEPEPEPEPPAPDDGCALYCPTDDECTFYGVWHRHPDDYPCELHATPVDDAPERTNDTPDAAITGESGADMRDSA